MRKLIKIILVLALIVTIVPSFASATKFATLGEYEDELKKYETNAENNRIAMNQTQAQINQANQNIENIRYLETSAILESEIFSAVKELPIYPDSGSIMIYNDVIYVRFAFIEACCFWYYPLQRPVCCS